MFTLYAGIAALLCGCSQIDIENNNLTGHNEVGIPNLNQRLYLEKRSIIHLQLRKFRHEAQQVLKLQLITFISDAVQKIRKSLSGFQKQTK